MDPTYTYIVAALIVVFVILLLYLLFNQIRQKKVTVVAKLAADNSGTITFTATDKTKTSITVTIPFGANSKTSCAAPSGTSTTLDNILYNSSTSQATLNVKAGSTKYAIVFPISAVLNGGCTVTGTAKAFNRAKVTIAKGSISFGKGSSTFVLTGS